MRWAIPMRTRKISGIVETHPSNLRIHIEEGLDRLTKRRLDFFLAALDQVHRDAGGSAVFQHYCGVPHFTEVFLREQSHSVNECQLRHAVLPVAPLSVNCANSAVKCDWLNGFARSRVCQGILEASVPLLPASDDSMEGSS